MYHSLVVYAVFKEKLKFYGLTLDKDSIKVIALLHDLCKANCYKIDYRNKKEGNQWIKEDYWKFDEELPMGHGDKSIYLASKYIRLTDVEALAIRWHMLWSTDSGNLSLGKAIDSNPVVVLFANSDHEASVLYEQSPSKNYPVMKCPFSLED